MLALYRLVKYAAGPAMIPAPAPAKATPAPVQSYGVNWNQAIKPIPVKPAQKTPPFSGNWGKYITNVPGGRVGAPMPGSAGDQLLNGVSPLAQALDGKKLGG